MGGYCFLGLKVVHHPICIVIERYLRTWCVLGAVGNFAKSFIGVAAARHKSAGPRSGFGCVVLACRHGSNGSKRYQTKYQAFCNQI
jgi:hypothetical protein